MHEKKIIIVGGGMTGLYLANILSSLKISCVLIEKNDLNKISTNKSDGRVASISWQSSKIIEEYGLWTLFKENYCPIEQIRITDNHSPLFLHFDNRVEGSNTPLGFMIENQFVLSMLIKNLQNSKYVEILDNEEVSEIINDPYNVKIITCSEKKIEGILLIAANGKFSNIRDMLKIKSYNYDYKQTAIVFNVSHEKYHHNIAQEIFMQNGPFAILPMKGGYNSSIVWTEKKELADIYLSMNKEDLMIFLRKKFTNYLGEINITSEIFSYPLSLRFSNQYFNERVCLIGDSAHFIHPIAGQGFNQTIRDIKCLVDLISEYKSLGLDIGGKMLLQSYSRARKIDNYAMIAITDVLNRLFSNNIYPIKILRKLGLYAVNKSSRLQKFFMSYAMGKR